MKNFYKLFLVAGMLITGSINTLVKKAQNDSVAKGLPQYDAHKFSHPWFQTAGKHPSPLVHPLHLQCLLVLSSFVCIFLSSLVLSHHLAVVMFAGEVLCLFAFWISIFAQRHRNTDETQHTLPAAG